MGAHVSIEGRTFNEKQKCTIEITGEGAWLEESRSKLSSSCTAGNEPGGQDVQRPDKSDGSKSRLLTDPERRLSHEKRLLLASICKLQLARMQSVKVPAVLDVDQSNKDGKSSTASADWGRSPPHGLGIGLEARGKLGRNNYSDVAVRQELQLVLAIREMEKQALKSSLFRMNL